MICWRSMMSQALREAERATYDLMSHSERDQEVFERRRARLSRADVRIFPFAAAFTPAS
jgi:hypothetical protein